MRPGCDRTAVPDERFCYEHNKKSEDETPVPPHRRSTGSVTSWGIVEAWLAGNADNRVAHRMGAGGHEVCAYISGQHLTGWQWELVRPNEDPSSAIVRAIGKL